MVSWRLIGLDSYSKNYHQISDLYTRALSFFFQPTSTTPVAQKETSSSPEEKETHSSNGEVRRYSGPGHQKNLNRGLQKNIRNLRDMINKQIITYTSSDHFLPTPDNIQALSIGSTAASHCLRSLRAGVHPQIQEQYDVAIRLLENYRNRQAYLGDKEIGYLMTGIAMLLSSLLVDCPPAMGVDHIMDLLRVTEKANDEQNQLGSGYLCLPMMVYALSQHDYLGWTQPPQPSSIPRAERAIEVIIYYVSHPAELARVTPVMVNLGLLELLSNLEEHEVKAVDIVTISEALYPMVDAGRTHIHTFPPNSYPYIFSRIIKSMATMVSNEQKGVLSRETVAKAYLTVLARTGMSHLPTDIYSALGEVYGFVIECVLTLPSSAPESYSRNVALDVMESFHDYFGQTPGPIPDLAQSLARRKIFARLEEAAEMEAASDDPNFVIKLFAAGQAWFLIDLAIKLGTSDGEERRRCLSSFVRDESLWNSPDLAIRELEEQRNALAERYREMWDNGPTFRRHSYPRILYDSLPLAGTSPPATPPQHPPPYKLPHTPQHEPREPAPETPAAETLQPSIQSGLSRRNELSEIDLSSVVMSEGNPQSCDTYIRDSMYRL
ncbi:unnamed protein product [Rhizoctonia solani]|uniref:Uncharacterized protein n=1 Tax=Rhizoctonia solani TaxID=456999 RepID=A0A8H2X6N3_9AGAM|nr:unnamed protein product [Rhizoctonia solani]